MKRFPQIDLNFAPRLWSRGRTAVIAFGVVAFVLLWVVLPHLGPQSQQPVEVPVDPESAGLGADQLEDRIRRAEAKLLALSKRRDRLFPSGPAILVDTAINQIYLMEDSEIVVQDKCSTGTGFELTDEEQKRTWTFDTPRGHFRVVSKVSDPVWYRPDWAFVEEGTPIPKERSDRAVAEVLGDYALAIGDGYFIHGTLYTRTLGARVTHGCIRVDDESLKKIFDTARAGTPVWIY